MMAVSSPRLGGFASVLLLASPATAADTCWRRVETQRNECRDNPCSDICIGEVDKLFRQWESCLDVHDSLIDLFDEEIWECFDDYELGHPYICTHMAMFAKACEEELMAEYGFIDLHRTGGAPSQQCAKVVDGCTGVRDEGSNHVGCRS